MPILKLYGKSACATCKLALRLLEAKKIEVEYLDVEADPEAFARVQELGYLGVPVFEDGDQHYSFNPDRLNESINARVAIA